MPDYDVTEKVERTDKGFCLTVESTRGTGTLPQNQTADLSDISGGEVGP